MKKSALAVLLLTACSSGQNFSALPSSSVDASRTAVPAAGARAKTIYFAGNDATKIPYGNAELGAFSATASGNVAPLWTIEGSNTGFVSLEAAYPDSSGNIWTCDFNANKISEFSAGSHGNVAPHNVIGGSSVPIEICGGVAVKPNGTIYASSWGGSGGSAAAVYVWNAGAHGNAAPNKIYHGSKTTLLEPTGLAFDSFGRLYVSSAGVPAILRFGSRTGNVAPQTSISGTNTGFAGGYNIAIAPGTNDIFVANEGSSSIAEFKAGAKGNVAPIATIGGSKTQLNNPYGIAVDAAGYIYTGNCPQSGSSRVGFIAVFKPGANGNVKPVQVIRGTNANLTCVAGISVR